MSPEKEPQPKFNIEAMSLDDVEAATQMRTECWLDTYINEEAGVSREWVEEWNRMQITPEKNAIRKERLNDPGHNAG